MVKWQSRGQSGPSGSGIAGGIQSINRSSSSFPVLLSPLPSRYAFICFFGQFLPWRSDRNSPNARRVLWVLLLRHTVASSQPETRRHQTAQFALSSCVTTLPQLLPFSAWSNESTISHQSSQPLDPPGPRPRQQGPRFHHALLAASSCAARSPGLFGGGLYVFAGLRSVLLPSFVLALPRSL